jgi:hypothetical protein
MDLLSLVLLAIFAALALSAIGFLLVAITFGPDDYWY